MATKPSLATPSVERLAALLADWESDGAEAAALAEARAMGPDAAAAAISSILDSERAAPEVGYAGLAALRLATHLALPATVPALVAYVVEPLGDDLWEEAVLALSCIGAPAVEGLLLAFEARRRVETRNDLARALLATEVKDDRILEALIRLLDEDVEEGASRLAEYGDPRALPALGAALDRERVDPAGRTDILANAPILDLADAIEWLGGTLTTAQRAKKDRALGSRDRLFEAARRLALDEPGRPHAPARRAARPGRNDPCHCGSGQKYKKCHLDADDGARA